MKDELFFAAEIDHRISVIDLHFSSSIPDALSQLHRELFLHFRSHKKYVKVVYGIGTGKLAKAVQKELSRLPIVQTWKETNEGGSCIVIF